uniref:ABC transporter permease n=1 Tax=Titanophycus setchellii TaxID=940129 RepID=A0A1G4NXV7_9FLOR|nr:Hypothetical protein ycf63 [Titanophycus setchellii]SCW23531.1 Hypothetical protein ycf63 [Titanophycus setchellii]
MHMNFADLCYRIQAIFGVVCKLGLQSNNGQRRNYHLLHQMYFMGIGSIVIVLLTSCFIGMIFTFQVARELTYLHAVDLVGSILTVTFLRELSPVLTAIIVTGRIGAAYTAEIASMQVTSQIDILYILHIDPVDYLIRPRTTACVIMLPLLNFISLAASIVSSMFIATMLYDIAPIIFMSSSYGSIHFSDILCSFVKTIVFSLLIAVISCTWGLTTSGGSTNVGKSTTSSVVTILITIFVVDFFLSLLMFKNAVSLVY